MRRLPSVVSTTLPVVVLATLLAVLLLVPVTAPAAAASPDAAPADVVLLAAEEGEGAGPAGPEPDPHTTHAPPEYEPPFLINAAIGLTALLVLGVLAIGGLYWLLVKRPRSEQQA